MSKKKKFLDLFIKADPDESNAIQSNVQNVCQSQVQTTVINGQPQIQVNSMVFSQPAVTPVTDTSVSVVSSADVNVDIIKNLQQVLIDKNLPGPDYLEVKQNAKALEDMKLPLDKCYEAGFRTIHAANPDFTKEKLLESIDTYINYVEQERADGMKECDVKRQAQVGDKQIRIQQLVEHKEDLAKQIAELQSQITSTDESIATLRAEVTTATAEIDQQERVFNNSINQVIANLNSDKEIMSKLTI